MTTSAHPLTLLCVHPHPDDESIACGGVLARAADEGIRTVVVTCTGGEEGENLARIDLGDRDLADHRRRELADALAALGVASHHTLGYRDSGMAGEPSNGHVDSFVRVDVEVAAAALAAIIRAERPQVVVSDGADGTYGHPDHVKANRVTVRAVELASDVHADVPGEPWHVAKRYVTALARRRLFELHQGLLAAGLPSPFGDDDVADPSALSFGTDDAAVTTEIDVQAWLPRKRAALACHRSQISADSFFLNTPPELEVDAFAVEQFVLEVGELGDVDADGYERDLFAGLRGVDPDRFKAALGSFVTGVTAMTTLVDGVPHGMTANAVTSVSLSPPLVLVCVGREASMAEHVDEGGVFALSFLARDQRAVSDRFADPSRGDGHEQFDGLSWEARTTGAPVLHGVAAWVDCRVHSVVDGGDHLIVIGEVVDVDATDREPLAYLRGRYGGFLPAPDATDPEDHRATT